MEQQTVDILIQRLQESISESNRLWEEGKAAGHINSSYIVGYLEGTMKGLLDFLKNLPKD
jgi:hypothetical protein